MVGQWEFKVELDRLSCGNLHDGLISFETASAANQVIARRYWQLVAAVRIAHRSEVTGIGCGASVEFFEVKLQRFNHELDWLA